MELSIEEAREILYELAIENKDSRGVKQLLKANALHSYIENILGNIKSKSVLQYLINRNPILVTSLGSGFVWEDTEQKHDYWSGIYGSTV